MSQTLLKIMNKTIRFSKLKIFTKNKTKTLSKYCDKSGYFLSEIYVKRAWVFFLTVKFLKFTKTFLLTS